MPWTEVNGAALRYEVTGDHDPVLVLVHEMGGTLESWDAVMPMLATSHRIVRYDTRGAGLSEKIRGTGDIDVFAADIEALLAALGIDEPVALAGVAVGAAIAIRFASRYRERTSALIAMSPATGIAEGRRVGALRSADAMESNGIRPSINQVLAVSYPDVLRGDMAAFGRVRCQRLGNDPGSQAAIHRMLAGLDMREDYARIRCPVLVIGGEHDGLRPPDVAGDVARQIAGARFEVLPTAHFMPAQTPDPVASLMQEFLGGV